MITAGNDRMPSYHFEYKGVDVRQSFSVGKVRQPILSNDVIKFCLSFSHYIRMENNGQEECVYRRYSLSTSISLVFDMELGKRTCRIGTTRI